MNIYRTSDILKKQSFEKISCLIRALGNSPRPKRDVILIGKEWHMTQSEIRRAWAKFKVEQMVERLQH